MQFITIIALALPLVSAPTLPETGTRKPAPQAARVIDRDAFNAVDRSVVLELPKAQ